MCFRIATKKYQGPWAQLSPSEGSQSVPANSQVTAVLANNAWHRNVVLITPSELPAATGTKSTSPCQGRAAAPSASLEFLPPTPPFRTMDDLVGREIKDSLVPSPLQWAGIPWQSSCASPAPVQQIGKDSGPLKNKRHHCKFTDKGGLRWARVLPQSHHSQRAELIKLLSSTSTNNIPCKASHHHL